MISRDFIGLPIGPFEVAAEAGQIRLFSKATGQTDPVFFDTQAARAAGYRDIVAPPTFVHALQYIGQRDPFALFATLGVKLEDTLHGTQSFTYSNLVCAGDVIRFEGVVSDIYAKKNGALEFFVQDMVATNQLGREVARIQNTTIVVNR
jgi:acyl dehydratase